MTEVLALGSFEHSGPRRRGDRFHVSERIAGQLAAKGLVELLPDSENPPVAAGTPSSASPAAPASPLTTASVSGAGGKKKPKKVKKAPGASS